MRQHRPKINRFGQIIDGTPAPTPTPDLASVPEIEVSKTFEVKDVQDEPETKPVRRKRSKKKAPVDDAGEDIDQTVDAE